MRDGAVNGNQRAAAILVSSAGDVARAAYRRRTEAEEREALGRMSVKESIAVGEALLTSDLMRLAEFLDDDAPVSLAIALGIERSGRAPQAGRGFVRREMRIHCDAFGDAAGVRAGQRALARNDRTRCHHSGYRGFFGSYASYQNPPAA